MKVIWSDTALARLLEIDEYIRRDNPLAATDLVDALIERGVSLAKFPEKGREVPELAGSGLRELITGNYRLVYRAAEKRIDILTVFEAHRLFPLSDIEE